MKIKNNKSFFEISAKTESDSTVVRIHDEIGGWGMWAQDFINEISQIKSKQIVLDIFSPGGSVYHGLQIIDAIRSHESVFTAKIGSFAGSMATIIASCCDKVKMAKAATYWIHRAQGGVIGDAETIREYGDDLEKLESKLIPIYQLKTGKSIEQISEWMAEDRPWTAEEALERGFIDELYDPVESSVNAITPALLNAVANIKFCTLKPLKNGKPKNKMENEEKINEEVAVPKNSTKKEENTEAATIEENPINIKSEIDKALKVDRERQSEIRALGQKFNFTKDAEQFAASDNSAEEFRKHILNKSQEDWKASLDVKNPAQQDSEADLESVSKNSETITAIKAKRAKRYLS